MAFTIHARAEKKPEAGFIAEEKLYVSSDGARLVEKTDPDVGSLYAGVGDRIPMPDAIRFGLVKPEVKESKPAENKEAKPQSTKAKKPPKKASKGSE